MNKDTHTQSANAQGSACSKSGRPILHLSNRGKDAPSPQLNSAAKIAYEKTPSIDKGDPSADDKFASCEDNAASDEKPATPPKANGGSNASEKIATAAAPTVEAPSAEPSNSPSVKTALELAIDRLTALGDKSDTMVVTKWGKRNASILAESLNFLATYAAASEAERKAVRKTLKANSGVSREPNVDNLPVIAVYMGVSCTGEKRTKAQRKEWCRFATVVKVAARASIKPEDAAEWLENKTLNGVLAAWRDIQKAAGKRARKPSVPKTLKDYTHLAAALAKGSRFLALAKEELAKADATIGRAMSEAVSTSANAGHQAEEATANA